MVIKEITYSKTDISFLSKTTHRDADGKFHLKRQVDRITKSGSATMSKLTQAAFDQSLYD
jgi:hypothetical protein